LSGGFAKGVPTGFERKMKERVRRRTVYFWEVEKWRLIADNTRCSISPSSDGYQQKSIKFQTKCPAFKKALKFK